MSDFQKLIDSLDPLSGENLSAFNESEVKEFIDSLKHTEKYTNELIGRNKKRIKFDKFLDNKRLRDEKKREAEDKRKKKVRLEDTVEFTEQKVEDETDDGLIKALTQLLAGGALTAALAASNPELFSKIQLKKLTGVPLKKFIKPRKTPKPSVPERPTRTPSSVARTAAESATRTPTSSIRGTTAGENIISRIFGTSASAGRTIISPTPRGLTAGVQRPRVEVEIPGKGFRTVQESGRVNNLLQEIREKAVRNGFTPSEASKYANSWKDKLIKASRVSANTLGVVGKGIIKSLPFIGATLGYVSANQRAEQGFTRLAALERTIAGVDVFVGVSGVTGVGTGAAGIAAAGTFLADMGLLVVDLVDMATEVVTGKKLASNAVEYWLSQFDKRPKINPTRNIKDPKFIRPEYYDDYLKQIKELNPTGARFQSGGRVRRFQTGGSTDGIALNTIKHHEALSSLTPGQNDYVKSGSRSVISGIPWSRINGNTKIYSYRDSKGIPTIGWGTVTQPNGRQTRDGEVITKQQADNLLNWNYQNMKKYMSRVIPTWNGMSPSQQAAIMVLTYNTGPGWFATSGDGAWPSLTRAIVSGDFRGALRHWSGSDTVLEPRRREERMLFSRGPAKPEVKKQKQGETGSIDAGVIGKLKNIFGFQSGGSIGNLNDLQKMSSQGMTLSMGNVPMSVITRGGASSVNEMKQFEKIASRYGVRLQSGGIVLFSGHGDILDVNGTNGLIGSINGETAEQHYTKKVASAIRDKSGGKIKYIPSQVKWRAKSDPEPANSNWNLGKKQASIGNIPIELHFDTPTGRSGLITSNLNRPVSESEKGLISAFGTITGDYGAGKYGVSMLELEPMKRSVAVSSLADKFIKAVEGKYGTASVSETSSDSSPATQPQQSSIGQSISSGISSLIPGLDSFMKGFAEGFKQTSGIDLGLMFGQTAQAAAIPPPGSDSSNVPFSIESPPRSNEEAFKKIYDAAKRAGDPVPELTAAQAMFESGWLSSKKARELNNPFGQTGAGDAGSVFIGDRRWAKYSSYDAAVKARIRRWATTTPAGGPGYASAGGAPIPGLKAILNTYAPASENDHSAYIGAVSNILRQFGFDPNKKNMAGIRIASRQYGGFMDNSIQSRIVKQMVNGSYTSINNNEPQVVILNQPQTSTPPVLSPVVSIPKFSFEYITGDGTDGFMLNELYGLLQLSSL
jgi:GH24 family phage-related lysozyme (muramidase)/uncharacterized FlgJ-related protein